MKLSLAIVTLLASSLLNADNNMQNAELDCLVRPEMYIDLSSPVDTTLSQMLVNIGDTIKKGQPLVQLESTVEWAKVKLAKLQADSNTAIDHSTVQLKFAKRNKKRIQDLYKKKSISLHEKEKADTEVALAEIALSEALEKKLIAQFNLKKIQAELRLRSLSSPIDGIVVDIYAMAGESVNARPIMKLAQTDPLRVELIAPTEYYGLIKKDMEIEILPERPVNKTYKASVTVVDQLIDSASGSFTVRMSLPNPGDELVGGVNCIARFNFKAPNPDSKNIFGANNSRLSRQ